MHERKWHAVIGSSAFKPGFGRFERGGAVIMVVALGFGMALFQILTASVYWPTWLAFLSASTIPASTGIFLACFVVGKPRHYARHVLTWRWMRLAAWLATYGIPIPLKPLIEIKKDERK